MSVDGTVRVSKTSRQGRKQRCRRRAVRLEASRYLANHFFQSCFFMGLFTNKDRRLKQVCAPGMAVIPGILAEPFDRRGEAGGLVERQLVVDLLWPCRR